MVNIEQVEKGIHSYAERELASKVNGLSRFAVYMVLPSVNRIVYDNYEKLRHNGIIADMLDDEGNIDIDMLRERAITAMEHVHSIEMYGFRFSKDDIDMLYDHITKA